MEQVIVNTPKLRWSIIQRGYWVHGVSSLRGFLRVAEPFTMDGRAEQITCPTLLTAAENDPLSAGARAFFDALRCPKTLIRFTAAQGAGEHCEMRNRSLLNARVLDWLGEVLSA
jgi:pimeloyl-ACP methyl ester carboxylesterase